MVRRCSTRKAAGAIPPAPGRIGDRSLQGEEMLMRRVLACVSVVLLSGYVGIVSVRGAGGGGRPVPTIPETTADAEMINNLLDEMSTVDLDSLQPLTLQSFVVPAAGVDVMRVQLQETYTIKGVGRDTVNLKGWIAVKHGQAYAARGEQSVRWGTAVSDTEFVGLELSGVSPLFGPVHVSLDPSVASAGIVGKIEKPFLARIGVD